MKITSTPGRIGLVLAAAWGVVPISNAWAKLSPAAETLKISNLLKPISDDEWKSIAGDRIQEKYAVSRGDTLYGISRRLFGDPKFWPKIWALNNGAITNPHVIKPGDQIAFLPGTGTSLPTVRVNGEAPNVPEPSAPIPKEFKGRSQQWKMLPRQSWETVNLALPKTSDPMGFDRRNKIFMTPSTGFELTYFTSSDRLPVLGEITGSRKDSTFLMLGDSVYIEAQEELEIGETYSLTMEPELLKSRRSDRVSYTYLNMGRVKIIGLRDQVYIGTLTWIRDPIPRGALLTTEIKRIPIQEPVPGPKAVEGILLLNHTGSTFTTAQFKTVFIDRGAQDGVKPGMVFRAYQHYDPATDKKITNSDFIIIADFQVIQVSDQFCTAIVIGGYGPVAESSYVILLTDVSELLDPTGVRQKSVDLEKVDSQLDDLDQLDNGEGLDAEGKKELKQLENWKDQPVEEPQPEPIQETQPAPETPTETAPPAEETPPVEEAPPAEELPPDTQAPSTPESSGTELETSSPESIAPPAEEPPPLE